MKTGDSHRGKKEPSAQVSTQELALGHGLENLLNKKEAARYLGIAQRTLDSYLLRRKIPYYKLGLGRTAGIRFKRADLEAALEKYRVEAVDNI